MKQFTADGAATGVLHEKIKIKVMVGVLSMRKQPGPGKGSVI